MLLFRFTPVYPLEPLEVRVDDSKGLTVDEGSELNDLLTEKARGELLGQLAVFPLAQDVQEWMNDRLEARLRAKRGAKKKKKRLLQGDDPSSSAEDPELDKRIADDLRRKRELLLRTPDPGSEGLWTGEGKDESSDSTDSLLEDEELYEGGSSSSSSSAAVVLPTRKEGRRKSLGEGEERMNLIYLIKIYMTTTLRHPNPVHQDPPSHPHQDHHLRTN